MVPAMLSASVDRELPDGAFRLLCVCWFHLLEPHVFREMPWAHLAERTGMPEATARTYITQLVAGGYLEERPGDRYRLLATRTSRTTQQNGRTRNPATGSLLAHYK